jgi:hypothetical protein
VCTRTCTTACVWCGCVHACDTVRVCMCMCVCVTLTLCCTVCIVTVTVYVIVFHCTHLYKDITCSLTCRFEPLKHNIVPPHFRLFVKYLKNKGKRWTRLTSPKRCPICQKGPENKARLDYLICKLLSIMVATVLSVYHHPSSSS